MVRAHPQYDSQGYSTSEDGDWQDLRSELVALLDQVETQVARAQRPDPGFPGLAERMRDLRHQVTEVEPETRHREALRSVQRAVAKFSDRDDESLPPNPRDTLESAIQQIRSRHFTPPPAAAAAPPLREPPPRVMDSPRFDELASAVGGISGRLERLESELRTQAKGQTANVKDIADQVGQLSQVVELLAGAVGETGQVKRLEAQIAGLAKLIAKEPQVDVPALTRRLDDVAMTVSKLAELQKAYADRADNSGLTQRLDDVTATVGRLADLQVRLVDRTDNSALSQRLDDVTATVGRLADLQNQLVDKTDTTGLNQRLDDVTATIGRLADLQVKFADRADTTSITRRLDDVTATVGKLADLQVQLVDKTDTTGLSRQLDDVTATMGRLADLQVQFVSRVENPRDGLKEAMQAIEAGVRNIYDRVDAIERQMTIPQSELEKVTDELQRFAAAMKTPQQPQGLIELVDALNERISDMEMVGPAASIIKEDIQSMRSAVLDAMEPRFAAIETQLENIAEKVEKGPELSIGQLEAQVRQLVARMDQTGEQLTGLAKLYSQPVEREPAPDFDTLADMVAERTSAAISAGRQPEIIGQDALDEIEKRLSRVVQSAASDRPAADNSALQATIDEVNERLARLEKSVARPAPLPLSGEPAHVAAPPVADTSVAETAVAVPEVAEVEYEIEAEPVADPIAKVIDDLEAEFAPEVEPEIEDLAAALAAASRESVPPRDFMPANPAEDAPLYDIPFADPTPVQTALEAKNGPRRRHPGMPQRIEAEGLPAAPTPSIDFGIDEGKGFTHRGPDTAPAEPVPVAHHAAEFRPAERVQPLSDSIDVEPEPAPAVASDVTSQSTSRSTFIAAARRAAMRQQSKPAMPAADEPAVGGSLMARAFSRFHATRAATAPVEAEAPVPPPAADEATDAPAKPRIGFGLGKRKLAGDKDVPADRKRDKRAGRAILNDPVEAPSLALDAEDTSPEDDAAPKPGFLTRYRTLILAVVTLLALAALANLLLQRGQALQVSAAAIPDEVPVELDPALSPTPMAQQLVLPTMPDDSKARVIPMTDMLQTASIDATAAQGFTAPEPKQPLPEAVSAITEVATSEQPVAKIASLADTLPAPEPIASPVQVEMPPASIGPDQLRQAAASGDVRAQFEVAAIYTEGRAVPEDLKAAAVWYERAASQGFAPAQYRLGNLYEAGKGVDKDLAQARIWYQQAAEAGNRMAMHNLAALYASGGLGTQQFDSAAKWFEEAANRGMRDSQFNLGMLYARGLGVKQDLAASYKWFGLAASRGDADAAKARDDMAKSLDSATVQRVKDEIAAWKPMSFDLAANFAPIGTWMKDFDPGAPISRVEVVKGVQQVLKGLGFDVGTPDGLAGPKTAEAIKAFERSTGMNETGTINPRLLAVLGSQPV